MFIGNISDPNKGMSGHGKSTDEAHRPALAPGKAHVLTFDYNFGTSLHNQLTHLSPESRATVAFIGNCVIGALHGVSRVVAPQHADQR
jgi:hypothetical protein